MAKRRAAPVLAHNVFLALAENGSLDWLDEVIFSEPLVNHEKIRKLGLKALGRIRISSRHKLIATRRLIRLIGNPRPDDTLELLAETLSRLGADKEMVLMYWRKTKVGSSEDERFQVVMKAMGIKFPERKARRSQGGMRAM